MLSNIDMPPKRRAAAFWTDCSRAMSLVGSPDDGECDNIHCILVDEWGDMSQSSHMVIANMTHTSDVLIE